MGSRVTKIGIREYEQRLRELTGSLQATLTEARLVRRTLEVVDEMRHAVASQLTRPRRLQHLDLTHANRIF